MSATTPRVGFIGIGLMGRPMASRLLDSTGALVAWTRTTEKLQELARAGATIAASPSDVASKADVVCLCLQNAAAVEDVVFGKQGVLHGSNSDTIVVDFSSIAPTDTRAFSDRLHTASGAQWIDAPVSGGVPGAEAGKLIILCGGPSEAIDRVQKIFDAVSRRVTRMGDVGAGQLTKLCNQLIVATNIIAITEALAMGRKNEIEIERLPAALEGGWADSTPLQLIGPRIASGNDHPRLGELNVMLKDIEGVISVSRDSGLSLPLADQAAEIYRRASEAGLAKEDISAIRSLYPIASDGE